MFSSSSKLPRRYAASAKNAFVKSSASGNESREGTASEMNGSDSVNERSEKCQHMMTSALLNEKSFTRVGAVDHHRAEGAAGKLMRLMMTRLL